MERASLACRVLSSSMHTGGGPPVGRPGVSSSFFISTLFTMYVHSTTYILQR